MIPLNTFCPLYKKKRTVGVLWSDTFYTKYYKWRVSKSLFLPEIDEITFTIIRTKRVLITSLVIHTCDPPARCECSKRLCLTKSCLDGKISLQPQHRTPLSLITLYVSNVSMLSICSSVGYFVALPPLAPGSFGCDSSMGGGSNWSGSISNSPAFSAFNRSAMAWRALSESRISFLRVNASTSLVRQSGHTASGRLSSCET